MYPVPSNAYIASLSDPRAITDLATRLRERDRPLREGRAFTYDTTYPGRGPVRR